MIKPSPLIWKLILLKKKKKKKGKQHEELLAYLIMHKTHYLGLRGAVLCSVLDAFL